MGVAIIIPARHDSSRFPGKPLVPLRGATGQARPLIQRTWQAAMAVPGVADVVIATDDGRIAACARDFGARVVMTSPGCRNGTERCAEAARLAALKAEVIVNIQGDAPLTPPWFVTDLIAAMTPAAEVATPVLRCAPEGLRRMIEDRAAGRVGATTAVFDRAHRALYFSKQVLPFVHFVEASAAVPVAEATLPGDPAGAAPPGDARCGTAPVPVFHHVGIYAYTPAALAAYGALRPGPLEALEGLEQLRFLENGWPVTCVEVEARGGDFWELNTPADVARIEDALCRAGMA